IATIEAGRFDRTRLSALSEVAALHIFHDRSTARVADVASVILRDICGWMICVRTDSVGPQSAPFLQTARQAWYVLEEVGYDERKLLDFATSRGWGGPNWV